MKHNWTYKKLGELVIFDKRFQGIDKSLQKNILSFSHVSAEELKAMEVSGGNVRLLSTGLYDGFTTEEIAGSDLSEGEIITIPTGGSPNLKYYKGKFVDSGNILLSARDKSVLLKFVHYALLANMPLLERNFRGASIKHPQMAEIWKISLPHPSLDEQKSIVQELDGINRLIDLQEEQLREYDRLAQSLFYTTFGDPVSNPKGWEVKKLGEVCDVRDGTHDSPQYLQHSDYLLITSKNIVDGRIDFSTATNYISKEDYDAINKRSKVEVGDIIMPMIGTIGHPIIVREAEQRYCIKNVALIKFCGNSDVVNAYVKMLIDSPSYMQYMLGLNKGGTQKFIALGTIRQLSLPLPPLALQQSFAAQIEAIEQQKALVRKSLEETRTLLAARMQYYFE